MITRKANFTMKQETDAEISKTGASSSSTTTATSWSKSKDPRIVRVSRAFGGKDRHSKVCTVRGLRDRRVRLSVPTAIQLYDLQDRLGLNQPSKVVDWLLNAAKNEIDGLPPLQFPQGQNLQSFFSSHHGLIASDSDKQLQLGQKINWGDPLFGGKSKDVSGETSYIRDETWDTQGGYNNFLSRQNPTSHSSLMNSTTLPYNSFVRWDPPNLTLSHPPQSLIGSSSAQDNDPHNFSLAQFPSGSSHQVLVYQPGMSSHPYFPSQPSPMDTDFNPK